MNGNLPSGEVWSSGVHFSSILSLHECALAWRDGTETLWAAASPSGFHGLFATTVSYNSWVVYQLDQTTGRALQKEEGAVNHPGTAAGNSLPQEVAEVVTLRTAAAGPSGRGRMFLPPVEVSHLTAAGRMPLSTTQAIGGAMITLFQHMATAGFASVLYSKGRANRPLTFIEVGDVFDAQRGRRDALVEARQQNGPIQQPSTLVRGPFGTEAPEPGVVITLGVGAR